MAGAIDAYVRVAKPGIVLGNLVAATGGALLASRGRLDLALVAPTLAGILLMVASACVLNNLLDRDLDKKMQRTRNRILVQGRMTPGAAIRYASIMGAAGTAVLVSATNALATVIVLFGFAIYVGVYTTYLKPSSRHSTAFGSLAGAAPPLAGYCSVSNRFDTGAWVLLAMFILWQLPHFYAIAIVRAEDYAAASIPALPVTRPVSVAKRHIIGYVLGFVPVSLMLTVSGYTGSLYLVVAAAVGLGWLGIAMSGWRATDEKRWARRLFSFSILTILTLSLMMSVDALGPTAPIVLTNSVP